jgi:hypothetical protein
MLIVLPAEKPSRLLSLAFPTMRCCSLGDLDVELMHLVDGGGDHIWKLDRNGKINALKTLHGS